MIFVFLAVTHHCLALLQSGCRPKRPRLRIDGAVDRSGEVRVRLDQKADLALSLCRVGRVQHQREVKGRMTAYPDFNPVAPPATHRDGLGWRRELVLTIIRVTRSAVGEFVLVDQQHARTMAEGVIDVAESSPEALPDPSCSQSKYARGRSTRSRDQRSRSSSKVMPSSLTWASESGEEEGALFAVRGDSSLGFREEWDMFIHRSRCIRGYRLLSPFGPAPLTPGRGVHRGHKDRADDPGNGKTR